MQNIKENYMETILIDENTLKIALDKADVLKYAAKTDFTAFAVENSIGEILKTASNSVGAKFDKGTFTVDAFTLSDGSCELYVTKNEEDSMYFTDRERNIADRETAKQAKDTFAFFELENLLSFLKELRNLSGTDTAEAYFDERHDVFYVISDRGFPIAGEFCGTLCCDAEKYYAREHFRPIGDGKISTLANLAL